MAYQLSDNLSKQCLQGVIKRLQPRFASLKGLQTKSISVQLNALEDVFKVQLSDGYIAYPNATLAFGEYYQVDKYIGHYAAQARFTYFEGNNRNEGIFIKDKSGIHHGNAIKQYEELARHALTHVPNLPANALHSLLMNMLTVRSYDLMSAIERFDEHIEFCYACREQNAPNIDIETILEVMFGEEKTQAQTRAEGEAHDLMKTLGFPTEFAPACAALRAAGLPPITIDDHEWAQGMYWRRVIIYLNN